MARQVCPLDGDQAKPGEASLQYGYRYAVTMKPNSKLEQNNPDIMQMVLLQQFDDFDAKIEDLKYEMDSKSVLHCHFTYLTLKKLRSYYPFFKKGWMIHMTIITDDVAYRKWKHYLSKSDPNDQVLFEARCQKEYMFTQT